MKTLVLGLGNDLLSDDGVGLRIASGLRERLAEWEDFTFLGSAEMGLSLLDLVAGYDSLVLVDAVQTGRASPGFVHELDETGIPSVPAVSPHFVGVAEVLALGRRLGVAVPGRLLIFAVEVQDPFTVGTHLTPALAAALPGIVQHIASRLRENRLNSELAVDRVHPHDNCHHGPSVRNGCPG